MDNNNVFLTRSDKYYYYIEEKNNADYRIYLAERSFPCDTIKSKLITSRDTMKKARNLAKLLRDTFDFAHDYASY